MKWLYIAFFFFMLIVGGQVIFKESTAARDDKEIRRYVETKGKAPKPTIWQNKDGIGKGI